MTSFELNETLRLSPLSTLETVGMQDLVGLTRAYLKQIGQRLSKPMMTLQPRRILKSIVEAAPVLSFSELDQAFVIWGVIALAIFMPAQFSSLSWSTQALIDAALTGVGIAATGKLTWRLACSERLRWVVCLWALLMAGGMIATAYGIFHGVGAVLAHLCLMWLGLCAAGYLAMGIGLRSRCFTAASLVHAFAIVAVQLHPGSQFLTSGWVMAATLFFFSVVPWDMRANEAEELCGIQPAAKAGSQAIAQQADSTVGVA